MTKPLSEISSPLAPQAIGPYSQAMRAGDFVYVSGQIPLDPQTQQLVSTEFAQQATQVFENILAIAKSAGTDFSSCVKINIALTDLADFESVNQMMAQYFSSPYPARACIGVNALPKGALIEVESIFLLPDVV